ncbi:hypothetical protein BpHYR1_004592 [Brachionus plicatilis]|uniref:Uncharacterized protein n=1 Tax=Brachionus plicatilis TaxID=10195 RepID=A0A3M7PAY7_BRAPC|nr:hypothetical protein BpHYR1_004592 [Brachionus plicatilis]
MCKKGKFLLHFLTHARLMTPNETLLHFDKIDKKKNFFIKWPKKALNHKKFKSKRKYICEQKNKFLLSIFTRFGYN